MKLLFDLFPVILFFAVFKFAGKNPETAQAWAASIGYLADPRQLPVLLATAVAIAATIAQVAWVKWHHGKVDTMLWVSFAIIAVFGGATLLLHDETFIKWKPTILYWIFAATLLFSSLLFKKNLIRAVLQEKLTLPTRVWNQVNLSWSLFFATLGVINLYVAFNFSTDAWVNFKLFGATGMMLIFVLLQARALVKYADEEKEKLMIALSSAPSYALPSRKRERIEERVSISYFPFLHPHILPAPWLAAKQISTSCRWRRTA